MKNGVNNAQTEGYNGARTVSTFNLHVLWLLQSWVRLNLLSRQKKEIISMEIYRKSEKSKVAILWLLPLTLSILQKCTFSWSAIWLLDFQIWCLQSACPLWRNFSKKALIFHYMKILHSNVFHSLSKMHRILLQHLYHVFPTLLN